MNTSQKKNKPGKKKGCEKLVEENSFRMCETEFPTDMNKIEAREKKGLGVILKNACDEPCVLDISLEATVVPKQKLCRSLSGKWGQWVDVSYTVRCVKE